jgi:ribosome maturation factor RimP
LHFRAFLGRVDLSRNEALDRLRRAAARVAGGYGLEIFDLQVRREAGGWILRVTIDRPEGPSATGQDESVGIADCQRVSHDLSALLDVEEDLTADIATSYTLEVSSPGLDRPLRDEGDYRRFTGRLAKVVTDEPIGGQSHFAGRLSGIEQGELLLTEGRRVHRVPLSRIRRARLDVEF